jgi:hypothetical protein
MGDKILTSDTLNLYQPIFCNLFNNPNGFKQYQNSKFNEDIQTNPAVSFSNQASEYNCLQKCKGDNWCTSYRYDTSNGNCTEYTTFPTNITDGPNGMNIGYNLGFNYDFANLSTDQKNNTILKCVNQYINNTYTPKNSNIDLSPCGTIGGVGSPTYTIATDAKCLYNIYNNAGIPVPVVSKANYITDPSIQNVVTDATIDTIQKNYTQFKKDAQNISNINNTLSSLDSEDNSSSNSNMFNNYLGSINDKKNEMNDYSNNIKKTIGIENFENQNKNNMYNNISKFLFFFIIILLIWYIIIMVCK